jgi:hypothetical protein
MPPAPDGVEKGEATGMACTARDQISARTGRGSLARPYGYGMAVPLTRTVVNDSCAGYAS